jgi:FkbM family methyltransferase
MADSSRLLKRILKSGAEALGIEISRRGHREFGVDAFQDMAFHVRSPSPVVLDIGANTGQSITRLRRHMPGSVIHSFEPSPSVFAKLRANTSGIGGLQLWNCAIGATGGEVILNENSNSDLSSVLPLGPNGWGSVLGQTKVNCRTLDEFVETEGLDQIDILKVDTQGYELEIFKGAESTMRSNKIALVFFEINFEALYLDLPGLPELFDFLTTRGFRLVSIYDIHHNNGLAGWGDALFIRQSYLDADGSPSPRC